MKFFYLHPNDVRWLCRWLRNNLLCMVAIVCFLLTIRLASSMPLAPITRSQVDHSSAATGDLPHEGELLLLTSRHPIPVAPEGWRRTDKGWEHVSTWRSMPRPLGEIIKSQVEREPAWLQLTLAKLRNVPPLIFALIQLTAITAIVNTSRNKKSPECLGEVF